MENCSQYQLKRIRKHILTQGVTPRVHGNHGKRPHNTFPLDIYQHATAFLNSYIDRKASLWAPSASSSSFGNPNANHRGSSHHRGGNRSNANKDRPAGATHQPVYLPSDVTRKAVHTAYKEYAQRFAPAPKLMGYSTFRHFMKRQFPHVKFAELGKPWGVPATGSTGLEIGRAHV